MNLNEYAAYDDLGASGVNVMGRSNTPEYSIAGSAENMLCKQNNIR